MTLWNVFREIDTKEKKTEKEKVDGTNQKFTIILSYKRDPWVQFITLMQFLWGTQAVPLRRENQSISADLVDEMMAESAGFPTQEDFSGAAFSLAQLQGAYRLNVSQLVRGEVQMTDGASVFPGARGLNGKSNLSSCDVLSWSKTWEKKRFERESGDGFDLYGFRKRMMSSFRRFGSKFDSYATLRGASSSIEVD